MPDDLPDDLQALFSKLEEDDAPPPLPEPDLEDELAKLESMEMPDALRPDDIQEAIIATQPPEITGLELPVDLEKYRDQLETVTTEVLNATRSDRKEAQDIIDLLRNLVVNQGSAPSKACVDGLVKAVEVKTNIYQNAIKIMEVNSKFLAATKPSMNFKQNNLTVSADDLNRVLESTVSGELD